LTSTRLTFSDGFAFLSSEQQTNFTWALERLRGLFMAYKSCPQLIVSDKDFALMNAISTVFP